MAIILVSNNRFIDNTLNITNVNVTIYIYSGLRPEPQITFDNKVITTLLITK